MFLNTFGINEKRISTVLNNATDTGSPLLNCRGRHGDHKTFEHRGMIVMDHINLFKVVEYHYLRKEVKYEYLPKELNVAEMYRMYNERCAKKVYQLERHAFYYRVFNIKFLQPLTSSPNS